MGKGKSMSSQRESARQTMSDRASGRTNDKGYRSEGSSYTSADKRDKAKRAAQLAAADAKYAHAEAERTRLAKIRGETITSAIGTQKRLTVQTNDEITGRAEIRGFQEGFSAETAAQTVGGVAAIGGGIIGSTVASGVRMAAEAALAPTDSRLQNAGRAIGKKASADVSIGGAGLGGSIASGVASAAGPLGQAAKLAAESYERSNYEYAGHKALVSNSSGESLATGKKDRRDTITSSVSTGPSLPTTKQNKEEDTSQSIEEVQPGIGISTGNVGGRKASFKKKKAVSLFSVGGARGRV